MRRAVSLLIVIWAFGFALFAVTLPRPAGEGATDAIIVPTGAGGRIARGLDVLARGEGKAMLVTGVDPEVRPGEFAAQYDVADATMACCVSLGYAAVDTRSNATETAQWMERHGYRSLRLVTTDWHMRRAAGELARMLPDDVVMVRDAVKSEPSLRILFLEYHKLLASWLAGMVPI